MKRLSFLFAPLLLFTFASSSVRNPSQQNTIDLTGVWQVSGGYDDGKEVCVKSDGSSFQANFIYAGFCPRPTGNAYDSPNTGQERPYMIKGTLNGTTATGNITACTKVLKLVDDCKLSLVYTPNFEATTSQDKITIKYRVDHVDYDEHNLVWSNCRVTPNGGDEQVVTLTRERCFQPFEDVCSFRVTRLGIKQAVIKACKERNITLPSWWELGDELGTGPSASQSEQGFVLPLEQYTITIDTSRPSQSPAVPHMEQFPLMLTGGVSVAPCMSPGGGAIITRLFIVAARRVGERLGIYEKLGTVLGRGDFNQKGLEQSIAQAFDAAKIAQYKKSTPPPR